MALSNDDLQAIASLIDSKLDEKLDAKLQPINNRLDKIESQVSALRTGQIELRKELKEVNIKVSDTYNLALDAWGTSTENRKWLESAN